MIEYYVGQIIVGVTIGVVVYYLTWARRKNPGNSLENNALHVAYEQERIARQQAEDRAQKAEAEAQSLQLEKNGRRTLLLTYTNGGRDEGEIQNGGVNDTGVNPWPDGQRYDGEWRDNQPTDNGIAISSSPSLGSVEPTKVIQTLASQPPVLPPATTPTIAGPVSAMKRDQLPKATLFAKPSNEAESDKTLPIVNNINPLTIGNVFTADSSTPVDPPLNNTITTDQQYRFAESKHSLPSGNVFNASPRQMAEPPLSLRQDDINSGLLERPREPKHNSPSLSPRKQSLPDNRPNVFNKKT